MKGITIIFLSAFILMATLLTIPNVHASLLTDIEGWLGIQDQPQAQVTLPISVISTSNAQTGIGSNGNFKSGGSINGNNNIDPTQVVELDLGNGDLMDAYLYSVDNSTGDLTGISDVDAGASNKPNALYYFNATDDNNNGNWQEYEYNISTTANVTQFGNVFNLDGIYAVDFNDICSANNSDCNFQDYSDDSGNNYIIIDFYSNGTIDPFLYNQQLVQVLVVGGGGGGPANGGGGGGAGGLIYNSSYPVYTRTYNIIVGAGGTAANGGDSNFATLDAVGGGAGGQRYQGTNNAGSGGSGGGGSAGNPGPQYGGYGTSGQGHNGGDSTVDHYCPTGGAGGGGAGTAGAAGTWGGSGGNGGDGLNYSINGTNMYYAGGGGGGFPCGGYGYSSGGLGGGGSGGSTNPATNGVPGTGGGGGGGSGASTTGGSGIVIISAPAGTINATGGIKTTVNGNDIWTFNSSGTWSIGKQIVITSGSNWTVPLDWNNNNNTIQVIGGGGGGDSSGGGANGGHGGGGGAYAMSANVTLTPGSTVGLNIGSGGAAGSPGYPAEWANDTYLCNSTSNCGSLSGSAVVVGAQGGAGGYSFGGGNGGSTGVGNVIYAGGSGGITSGAASGGGGAAGPYGNGGNGGAGSSNNQQGTGGGGGNGGGQNGSAGGGNGGAGGANYLGNGGGGGSAPNSGGSIGYWGGGGGGGNYYQGAGANGSAGFEWGSYGSGGGGGGGSGAGSGTGGLYGGGGGGCGYYVSNCGGGAQGIIVITYNPSTATPPAYSNITTNPSSPVTYSANQLIAFYSNWTNSSTLTTIILNLNGTNYTASGNKDAFNVSFLGSLGAGTYNYSWYANDSNDLSNITNFSNQFVINQASQSITPLLNGADANLTITYPQQFNASYSSSNQTFLNISINNNQILISTNLTYGAGAYIINWTAAGNQNYTQFNATLNLTINPTTSLVSLSFNASSPETYPYSIIPTCSVISGEISSSLNWAGNSWTSGNPILLGAGTWLWNCSYLGSQNYSQSSISSNFMINQGNSSVYTFINGQRSNQTFYNNTALTFNNPVWLNGTLKTGDSLPLNLTINGMQLNDSLSPVTYFYNFSTLGTYAIETYYSGNQNWTSAMETWYAMVQLSSKQVSSGAATPQCAYEKLQYYNPSIGGWEQQIGCI